MGIRPPGFEVFAFASLGQQELLNVTSNVLFCVLQVWQDLYLLCSPAFTKRWCKLNTSEIIHKMDSPIWDLVCIEHRHCSEPTRSTCCISWVFVNRKGVNYKSVNCFECAVLWFEVWFEFIYVYLAAIQNSQKSTSEIIHKTDSQHFDFQPACMSQFKYETNIYWGWKASRFCRFCKSKLNLNIFILFEGKANKIY